MRFWLALFVATSFAAPAWAAGGLFGLLEIKANRIDSIPKWVDVLGRIRAEGLYGHCRAADDACRGKRADWFEMVEKERGDSRRGQMEEVNDWLNNYTYIEDMDHYGRSDYWATPGQFVDDSGDCEDYAIAKYYTLKQLGWSEDDLRLVVVKDEVRQIPHAILAVRLEGQNYILDNLATEPLLDKYVTQYTPYYAVNAYSRWVFIKPIQ